MGSAPYDSREMGPQADMTSQAGMATGVPAGGDELTSAGTAGPDVESDLPPVEGVGGTVRRQRAAGPPAAGPAMRRSGDAHSSWDTGEPSSAAAGSDDAGHPAVTTGDPASLLDAACPYLRSADGTWRSSRPHRDHRCWGQSPPGQLAAATQSGLCLTEAHLSCEIYGAAIARRADDLARDHIAPERVAGRFGAVVQPVPLTLDAPPEGRAQALGLGERPLRVLGVAGVTIVLVLILAATVLNGRGPAATPIIAVASPTPAPTLRSVSPVTPAPSRAPASATPAATAPPTPVPSPTPGIARTYRVKAGDTLGSIARKFGVTKAQLRAVNDLGNPPVLTLGQIINIPFPAPSPSPVPSTGPSTGP